MDKFAADSEERTTELLLQDEQEALRWLRQVDGTVYHNRNQADDENAYVAVVRTPGANGQVGKIILAFGETVQEAAGAAEQQWDSLWRELSSSH